MCGIAGIISLNSEKVASPQIMKFTDSLAHRGPDGSGYELFEDDLIAFGHRRLSILDLSEAGKQPMYASSNKLIITYNGEVYNFLEIKNELKKIGHSFKTKTDTEVILKSFEQWGIACLKKFNGMFAIAIWNFESKSLTLIRDRFGVKPLYFLYLPDRIFAFASETIAFKNLTGFNREIHSAIFDIALQSPEIVEGSDKTIFKNIYQLLPGHYLTFDKGRAPEVKKWWSTKEHLINPPASYQQQIEEFTALFEDSCKLRMRSDVTLASALSGGLDSSSVYTTLHKIYKQGANIERLPDNWQQAFVATFPDTSVDEKQYAEKVVNATKGNAKYITPDYNNLVDDIFISTQLFDGLISTPLISISNIYKSMRQNGVTVSIDGHGVDEMMYGYNSYVFQAFYDSIEVRDFKKADEYAVILCRLSPNYDLNDLKKIIKSFSKSKFGKGVDLLINKIFVKSQKQTLSLTTTEWFSKFNLELSKSIMVQQDTPAHWSKSEKMLYNDFHFLSLPINLRDFDRASMQHGIEIRMPFMDYRLVSYVFSLPMSSKLGGGFTKRILRDAMKGTLTEDIRTRTLKIGIGAPILEWFERHLKEFVLDTVHSNSFKSSPHWNGNAISNEVAITYNNKKLDKTFCNKVWNVINAQIILNGNK
jgi:asparagine synthase (glutamine-hydrolysing)